MYSCSNTSIAFIKLMWWPNIIIYAVVDKLFKVFFKVKFDREAFSKTKYQRPLVVRASTSIAMKALRRERKYFDVRPVRHNISPFFRVNFYSFWNQNIKIARTIDAASAKINR